MRGILLVFLVMIGLGLGGLAFFRCEGSPPTVESPQPLALGREPRALGLTLKDEGAGLRDVTVSVVTPAGEQVAASREVPGGWLFGSGVAEQAIEVPLDLKALGLKDGEATLRVVARDWSWRALAGGGQSVTDLPLSIDTRPPRLAVENTQSYLQRGGAGLAVYQVGEDATRDGVLVGELFFRGHPIPGDTTGRRLAFFAIPQDAPPDPPIRVMAEDAAGNRSTAGWGTHFKERTFPAVTLNLSPQFLDHKVTELASARGIDATDRVAAFQKINSAGRAEDEKKVRDITQESVPEKLWDGAFEQLRNSKVTSHFAEKRSYFVEGQKISNATHYGYDLAVTMAAPITASNAGKVVWADDLGIYGGCVIVDHGFDLFTLYGHLSRIDVKPGDAVAKGQVLGLSGATGLAGGDHLHFATLLGGVYVDPVEWWDPKWIREKVDALLVPAPGQPPAAVAAEPAR
jgi:murein DD-endopeptidase MepM/ murein hydrolase activator NlpD